MPLGVAARTLGTVAGPLGTNARRAAVGHWAAACTRHRPAAAIVAGRPTG